MKQFETPEHIAKYGPGPYLTGDAVVSWGDEFALIKRKKDGCWALPGGFREPGETFTDAALRELREEAGLDIAAWLTPDMVISNAVVFDDPGRDPRGAVWTGAVRVVLSTSYGRPELTAGDDADDAQWFNRSDIPKLYADHNLIIETIEGCCGTAQRELNEARDHIAHASAYQKAAMDNLEQATDFAVKLAAALGRCEGYQIIISGLQSAERGLTRALEMAWASNRERDVELAKVRDALAALVLNIDAGGATLGAMADAREALVPDYLQAEIAKAKPEHAANAARWRVEPTSGPLGIIPMPAAAMDQVKEDLRKSGYISSDNGQGMGLPKRCTSRSRGPVCGGKIVETATDNICQTCGTSYGKD